MIIIDGYGKDEDKSYMKGCVNVDLGYGTVQGN